MHLNYQKTHAYQLSDCYGVAIIGQHACYTPKGSILKNFVSEKLNETAFRSLKKPHVYQLSDRYFNWCGHFPPRVFENNCIQVTQKDSLIANLKSLRQLVWSFSACTSVVPLQKVPLKMGFSGEMKDSYTSTLRLLRVGMYSYQWIDTLSYVHQFYPLLQISSMYMHYNVFGD